MIIRSPGAAFRPTATLPSSPRTNSAIFWTAIGRPLLWSGERWISPDGESAIWPAAVGVAARCAVAFDDGDAVLCDPTAHPACLGVVAAVSGGHALVVRRGLVTFDSLVPGKPYHVSVDAGIIAPAPAADEVVRLIHVGVALDENTLAVDTTRATRIG